MTALGRSVRGGGLALILALGGCRREFPVLLYHAVGCGTENPRDVPLAEFIAQLDAAQQRGFTFVAAQALGEPAGRLPPKPLGLTFDDGAECVYRTAFPVLAARRIPFTLFLPAEWVERPHVQDAGEGSHWPSLSADEIREMLKSGLVEIGAHGLTHASLRELSADQARHEIADSRQQLQRLFGVPVLSFAYPYGSFGRREVGLVRAAGYLEAFSVNAGPGGRLAGRRQSIHAGLPTAEFLNRLSTRRVLPWIADD